MEKLILTISGSPRYDGYSSKMLQYFIQSLKENSCEEAFCIRHYDSFKCSFAPCNDCRACRGFEGCANRDMDVFYEDFERADCIVIATPIYNLSFPAPLKVIIDRMQRYYNARFSLGKRPPIAKHRKVILLAAAGSSDEDGYVVKRQLERIFTVTNCELAQSVIFSGTDELNCEDNFPYDEIYSAASEMIKKI